MEEVGVDQCDADCQHCFVFCFLLQMMKSLATAGTCQLADVVFFVKDGFRRPALRQLS